MSLNGTSTLINGAITHTKVRGKALVDALSKSYKNEEKEGAAIELKGKDKRK